METENQNFSNQTSTAINPITIETANLKQAIQEAVTFFALVIDNAIVEFDGSRFHWAIFNGENYSKGTTLVVLGEGDYSVNIYKRWVACDIAIGLSENSRDIHSILTAFAMERTGNKERDYPQEMIIRTMIRIMKKMGVRKAEAIKVIVDQLHIKQNVDEIYRQEK